VVVKLKHAEHAFQRNGFNVRHGHLSFLILEIVLMERSFQSIANNGIIYSKMSVLELDGHRGNVERVAYCHYCLDML
jgi:hypothetical protein